MAAPAPLPKPSTLHRRAWMALALAGAATGVAALALDAAVQRGNEQLVRFQKVNGG